MREEKCLKSKDKRRGIWQHVRGGVIIVRVIRRFTNVKNADLLDAIEKDVLIKRLNLTTVGV